MKKLVWLVVCVILWSPLFSQKTALFGQKKKEEAAVSLDDGLPWAEGSILLTDETEMRGQVRYDDRTGTLSFHDGDDARIFNERRVIAFDFLDQKLNKKRQFVTLPFEDPTTHTSQLYFFEILKELRQFAILTKSDQLAVVTKEYATPSSSGFDPSGMPLPSQGPSIVVTKTTAARLESIYLMDKDGVIRRLFKTSIEYDPDALTQEDSENEKGKALRKDYLLECIGKNRYTLLEQYARENKLSFKRKEDLLKIIDYYVLRLEPSEG
ncbi:hypothetical protein KK062_07645 [Fulvivirgaceae bacterium PWU5]|uniref:Uncharacterized protein n=1 Tax=Dawidia cretensis TaxID=2782350 RepID=A0AAP2GTZ1_9BACT|nr:hypothetical protein [Dawidia cretensis]MBT1708090.1 hypothetical protein [Dawidia cretensis]